MPHRILNYLPFEALIDADGRFLVESFPFVYASSASSYAYLRARAGGPQGLRSVVAFGSPLLTASPDGPATEPRLRADDVRGAAVLHFATHGVIDEERPERSALALTALPPDSDGLLQMREIYGLQLKAALVTLSACQTALGKEVTGEGIIGLSRAFFYAGANAVMASLWNVNDSSTAEFMRLFYTALGEGMTIDRAAQSAKLAFIRSGDRRRHPYYWAAFIASGNAVVRVVAPSRFPAGTRLWSAAAAALALGGVIVAVVRRRGRTPSAWPPC